MPCGVSITSACASGIECVTRRKLQRERREFDRAARRHDVQLHLIEQLHLAQLAPQHRGGERRRVDRAAQLRPKPGHGADMVLVRMGDDQARPAGRAGRR